MKMFSLLISLLINFSLFAQFETNYSFNLDGANSARISATGFSAPNNVTITAWVYINSSIEQTIAAKNYNNGGTNSGQFEIFINSSGGLNFLTRVNGADIFSGSPGTLETGKWYFVVGKFDGTNVQSFINGILSSTNSTTGVIDNSSPHPFSVGCQTDPSNNQRNYFNGLIENLAVWNISLDINLIKDWMHKELTTSHPYYNNLMAFYKFNGANGNSYMWDATSNGRNLLITGSKNCYSTNLPPMCYTWGKLKDNFSEVRGIWPANLSNSSSILTITSSSLTATTNALWGHNNKSILWTYFDIPKTVLRRLDRVWYTEKEGSPTGDFIFNTSGLTFSDGNKLRLLVDLDGNFYNAQIVNGVYSSVNNTFTISNVNIGNNYYYTLAELTEGGGNSGPPSDPPPWKWKSPKPQGNNLRAVTVIDNNKFFAVGDGGTNIYTETDGSTWEVSHFLENFVGNINDCDCFPNNTENEPSNCIAVGDGGAFFKSSDYGRTWLHLSDIGLPENYSIKDIHIIDASTAFIGGSEGRIYKTTNSGESWTAQASPLTGKIASLNFYNSQIGWAFDDFSYATTTNGGTNWEWKWNLPSGVLSSTLLSETEGLIATNNGKIYKTTDIGTNWTESFSGSNNINKLTKAGGGILVLGTGNSGMIKKTTDNGTTWTSPTSPTLIDNLMNAYIKDQRIAIVGDNGITLKSTDGGNNFSLIEANVLLPLSLRYMQVENDGQYLITAGKMFRSSNFGNSWQLVLDAQNIETGSWKNNLQSVVGGTSGFLQTTTDGGQTFNDKSIGIGNNIYQIKIPKIIDTIYNKTSNAFGTIIIVYTNTTINQQIIAKSTDDGDSWSTIRSVSSSSDQIATDLTFAVSNIFVCTKDGKVLKSTNYGTSWITTTFINPTSFTKISFSNSSIGFVVGLRGVVYKTTDAGETWIQKTTCSNYDLTNVSVMSSNLAIVSTSNTIYETTDGGDTWRTSLTGLSSTINQLITTPKSNLNKGTITNTSDFIYYAIGEGGMILENEGGGIGLFPVELNYFSSKTVNNSVILEWQTATEVDNYGFNIEYKVVNKEWTSIGFVAGNGNSNSTKSYSFTHENPPQGKIKYRLKQIDTDGTFFYSNEIEVNIDVPKEFALYQNYPNPFNPSTIITYSIPQTQLITLRVYNILGEEIATLVYGKQNAGFYSIEFNATMYGLSSGVFFYTLDAGSFRSTKKMALTK